MGAATGDFDNDGRVDLYLTNFGPNQLWRNQGDGTFAGRHRARAASAIRRWSVSAPRSSTTTATAGSTSSSPTTSTSASRPQGLPLASGAADYCGPLPPTLRSPTASTATAATAPSRTSRRAPASVPTKGAGLGVVALDADDDGWLDLYVANDGSRTSSGATAATAPSRRSRSLAGCAVDRRRRGRRRAWASTPATSTPTATSTWSSPNLTGETNTLYRNDGARRLPTTPRSRLGLAEPSLEFTGFGTAFLDADNDGALDLLVVNGAVRKLEALVARRRPLSAAAAQPALPQPRRRRFTDVSATGRRRVRARRGRPRRRFRRRRRRRRHRRRGGQQRAARRGCSSTSGRLAPALARPRGDGRARRPRRARRRGRRCERAGAPAGRGARRRPTAATPRRSDPRVLFGLGDDETPARVRVRWPDGAVELFSGLVVDRYQTLTRGKGAKSP